jgi:hypothetical protein
MAERHGHLSANNNKKTAKTTETRDETLARTDLITYLEVEGDLFEALGDYSAAAHCYISTQAAFQD